MFVISWNSLEFPRNPIEFPGIAWEIAWNSLTPMRQGIPWNSTGNSVESLGKFLGIPRNSTESLEIAAALQAPLRGALCSACVSERLCNAQRMSIGSRIAIQPTWSGGTWQHRSIEAAWRHWRHCGGIANLDRVPAWRWVTECLIGCRPKRAFQNHQIPLVFWGVRGSHQVIRDPP